MTRTRTLDERVQHAPTHDARMRDFRHRVGVAVTAAWLAGCGTSEASGDDAPRQVASAAGRAIAPIEPVVLPNSGEEPSVTMPAGVVLLSGGRVAVIDQFSQRLHIFDIAGKHLASGGGKGEGPGQFGGAWGVVPAGGDSIAVWDATLRRLSIFDDSARFVRVERTSFSEPMLLQRRLIGRFDDGRFVLLEQEHSSGLPVADGRGTIHQLRRMVRVGVDGSAPMLELPPTRVVHAAAENGVQLVSVPMGQLRQVAACTRGLVVVLDSTITVYDAALTSVATFPNTGEATSLQGSARMDEIDRMLSHPKGKHFARDRAMLDAVQPRLIVRRPTRMLDASANLWTSIPGPALPAGTALRPRLAERSTLAGSILDTVNTPGADWPFTADGQVFVALQVERDTIDAATLLYRLPAARTVRDAVPDLGRCGAWTSY